MDFGNAVSKVALAVTIPRFAVGAILLSVTAAMLATAPVDYDFYDLDSPRHALNGAFVLDAIRALPWRDPAGYAANYYLHYPALSIGFYPPLFYVAEAAVYSVIGVSHFAAQLTVVLFAVVLSGASYGLARLIFPRWTALGAAVLLIGSPEAAFLTRQVMLDILAHAMLMVSVLFFARYLQCGRPYDLWITALALVGALYIKTTAGFILLPMAVALVAAQGWKALARKHVLAVAATAAVLLIPEALLSYRFLALNADNLGGRAEGAPLLSLERWTFYLQHLPNQLGWPVVLLAVPGLYVLWQRVEAAKDRGLAVLLIAWAALGYLIFSAVRIHVERHDFIIVFPVVLAAVAAVSAAFRGSLERFAAPVVLVLAFGTAICSLATPLRKINGYAAIAHKVAEVAPENAIVLSSMFRDANLVFAMRALETRPDIWIVRADKWLLHFSVNRSWGVSEAGYTRAELTESLHAHGVSVAVSQRGFWADLDQMALVQDILGDKSLYEASATLPVTGDLEADDRPSSAGSCEYGTEAGCSQNFVDILVPLKPLPAKRLPIEFDLPSLGQQLHESTAR